MTVTAMVMLSDVQQSSGMLTAYVGTAVRGVESKPVMPPFSLYAGQSMFQLIIYANGNGEALSFTFLAGGVASSLAETLVFSAKRNVGSVVASFMLTGSFPSSCSV